MELSQINFTFWILQSLAMIFTALLIPKLTITNPLGAIAMVIALAFINTNIWDAALFFNIPNHISTQAATLLLVNGVIFWILVKLLPGIEVEGFLPALIAPLVFTLCNLIIVNYGMQLDWPALFADLLKFIEQIKEHFFNTAIVKPE